MCHHKALGLNENGNIAYWSGGKKTRLPSPGFFSASRSPARIVCVSSAQRHGKSRVSMCVCVCVCVFAVLNITVVTLDFLQDVCRHE